MLHERGKFKDIIIYEYFTNGIKANQIAKKYQLNIKTVCSTIRRYRQPDKYYSLPPELKKYLKDNNEFEFDTGLDISGMRFNELVARVPLDKKDKFGNRYWLCDCDCGNRFEARAVYLVKNTVKSCGHKRTNKNHKACNWRGYEDIPGSYLASLLSGARERHLVFDITMEYMWQVFIHQNRQCALSGIDLYFARTSIEKGNASLDRIDSNLGYIPNNIQWLTKDINKLKQDFSDTNFIKLCKLVANYRKEKYV